jgi:hypothetical protein
MTADRWTLLDESQRLMRMIGRSAPTSWVTAWKDCQLFQQRLHGGLSDGVDLIRVKCGDVTLTLLPTRGMGIWKVWVGDEEIGWKSPNRGPVHPKFVPLTEPGGLGWLDGFDELLVRCGLESNGAPEFDASGRLKYPLHGRIANRPAHRCRIGGGPRGGRDLVDRRGRGDSIPLHQAAADQHGHLRRGEPRMWIRDEVENFSGSPAEMQLLYHINFGQPLLDPGSRFVAPVRRVVPRDLRAAEGIHTWNRLCSAGCRLRRRSLFAGTDRRRIGRDADAAEERLRRPRGQRPR